MGTRVKEGNGCLAFERPICHGIATIDPPRMSCGSNAALSAVNSLDGYYYSEWDRIAMLMARMCSAVLPQHAPIIRAPRADTLKACSAMISGEAS